MRKLIVSLISALLFSAVVSTAAADVSDLDLAEMSVCWIGDRWYPCTTVGGKGGYP